MFHILEAFLIHKHLPCKRELFPVFCWFIPCLLLNQGEDSEGRDISSSFQAGRSILFLDGGDRSPSLCFLFCYISFVITRNQIVFASVSVLVGFFSLTSLLLYLSKYLVRY